MARLSVKSVCEEMIKAGKSSGVIMASLRKKFTDKDDATFEKSIKYYASSLHRAGEIDDDAKAKYVGGNGRPSGKTKTEKAPKAGKVEKKSRKAKKEAAEEKPARKSRKAKEEAAGDPDKPARKSRKAKALTESAGEVKAERASRRAKKQEAQS